MEENKKFKVGHTCITWDEEDVETAVKVLAELGFHGVEIFGWTLDELQKENRLNIFEKHRIPLISAYFAMNLCEKDKFQESSEKGKRWAKIMQQLGTRYICMGGEDVNRKSYDFGENRNRLLQTVNEYGKIFTDMGFTVCFHPHTGTPIQTEYEIRSLMDAVNPDYVSFAPDVAQIQKGGADAVKIVKDYIELIKHIHLKDYDGIPVQYDSKGKEMDSSGFACYKPLGEGVVDIPAILALIEKSGVFDNMIMVELDGGKKTPVPQEEAARRNRDYLIKLGYQF